MKTVFDSTHKAEQLYGYSKSRAPDIFWSIHKIHD